MSSRSRFTATKALFSMGALITACATPSPPATAPTDLTPPPALADEGYVEIVVSADFPGTPEQVRAWLDDGNKIIYAMEDTENISSPKRFTLTKGSSWTETGAERILEFNDGHFTFERVITHSPAKFDYQIWGFTSGTGNNVDHIYGKQELIADPNGGTDFIWTYRVMPNAGWKRPFVRRFVEGEVKDFLQIATDAVEAQAAIELADR